MGVSRRSRKPTAKKAQSNASKGASVTKNMPSPALTTASKMVAAPVPAPTPAPAAEVVDNSLNESITVGYLVECMGKKLQQVTLTGAEFNFRSSIRQQQRPYLGRLKRAIMKSYLLMQGPPLPVNLPRIRVLLTSLIRLSIIAFFVWLAIG